MKRLMEHWRKLLEGEVIPLDFNWGADEEPSDEINPNAIIANEIENFILSKLKESAPEGVRASDHWSNEQWEVFDEVNELLNKLFPSGK